MGASSSGLLDEAKVCHIKGQTDSSLRSFSVYYRLQHTTAHTTHLHEEAEPRQEGRSLLLKHRPPYAPEEVLFQGEAQVWSWEESRKGRERLIVLRRDYSLEIHDSLETFSRGCAAKVVLHPAGGAAVTTEEASRALLEQSCLGILDGVKNDSSSVVSTAGACSVYLHLPYTGHTYFTFTQEDQQHHFLCALKTCIRHQNLDPWCEPTYESQAFLRALTLYRQDRGHYESWEMLLGTQEQVLAHQVMEEVLPWLQSELHSRLKGKRTDRMRQWTATVQASYSLVQQQLTDGLAALKEACRQTASANQAAIRANLDQIAASRCFLEDKLRACVSVAVETRCGDSVVPCLRSILQVLEEHSQAAVQRVQGALEGRLEGRLEGEGLQEALATLRSTSLEDCYQLVDGLRDKLQDLKPRFRFTNTQRLVHTVHMEMEQLLDSAVYTLELFLQASAKHQSSQIAVVMERAKTRVLKQLEHDSRVVLKRLYRDALLEITLPALTRDVDDTWSSELQQFDQYIFADYSSFILVRNVYDDILRDILSKEIEKVVDEAANEKSNYLQLDSADLSVSQYSLLGTTPPPSSSSSSPAVPVASDPLPLQNKSLGEDNIQRSAEHLEEDGDLDPALSLPVISASPEAGDPNVAPHSLSVQHDADLRPPTAAVTADGPLSPTPVPQAVLNSVSPNPSPGGDTPTCPGGDTPTCPAISIQDEPPATSPTTPAAVPPIEVPAAVPPADVPPTAVPHSTHPPNLASLSAVVAYDSTSPSGGQAAPQRVTDRAVYLTGWRSGGEVEREEGGGRAGEEVVGGSVPLTDKEEAEGGGGGTENTAVAANEEESLTEEQPTEEQPTGEHPTGEQPTGEHLTEEQPTGEHPTGEHLTEEHLTGEQPTREQPTGEHPTGEHLTEEHPTEERPTGEHPTGERPTGEHLTGEHPTGEHLTEEQPTGEHPTGEHPTGEHLTEEHPTEERPTGERPTGERPTGERPTEERPMGEHPTRERPTGEHPTGEHATEEHLTGERPTGEHPTEEHPTGKHPMEEHPMEEHPTEEHPRGGSGGKPEATEFNGEEINHHGDQGAPAEDDDDDDEPLDSISIIRGLVSEVIEVEVLVNPPSNHL